MMIASAPFDEEDFRAKLQAMTREELQKFGQRFNKLCSGAVSTGQIEAGSIHYQLKEAQLEWKRRNPKL